MTYVPRPKLQAPEYLKLPDGRQIRTQDLVNRVRDKTNHNLRTGRVRRRDPVSKYSAADLAWIAQATVPDIVARYRITEVWATCLRTRARHGELYQQIQQQARLDEPAQPPLSHGKGFSLPDS